MTLSQRLIAFLIRKREPRFTSSDPSHVREQLKSHNYLLCSGSFYIAIHTQEPFASEWVNAYRYWDRDVFILARRGWPAMWLRFLWWCQQHPPKWIAYRMGLLDIPEGHYFSWRHLSLRPLLRRARAAFVAPS